MKSYVAFIIAISMLSYTVDAQYQYSVSTLIPQNSNIIDDGLALDEQGTLYGSYWGIWQGAPGTHILLYQTDGSYDTLATGFIRPNGMSYLNGNIYLANGNGQIFSIDASSGEKEVFAQIPGGASNVIPVPGTDSLVVVGWSQNKLMGLSPSGEVTTLNTSPLYDGPVGAAFDPQGRLYIGNFNDGKILRFSDGTLEVFANLGGGIGFLTYSDGAILATNHTDKKVYRISLEGDIQVIAGSGTAVIEDGFGLEASFMSPNGIVATPSGDTIYVSEFAGKALRMITRIPLTSNTDIINDLKKAPLAYPLPNTGQLNLDHIDTNQIQNGIIRDSSGRVVQYVDSIDIKNGMIDLSNLNNGTYLLSLLDSKGTPVHHIKIPLLK